MGALIFQHRDKTPDIYFRVGAPGRYPQTLRILHRPHTDPRKIPTPGTKSNAAPRSRVVIVGTGGGS